LNHLNNFILNARQEEEKLKDIIFLMEEKIKGKQEAFEEIISLENTIKELNKKKILRQDCRMNWRPMLYYNCKA